MTNAWAMRPLPMTASGTAASGYAAANAANDFAGVVWRSTSGSTASILIDLGANVAVDAVALFGLAGAPSNATFRVAGATAAQGSAFSGSHTTSGTGSGNYWASAYIDLYAGTVLPRSGKGAGFWEQSTPIAPGAVRYLSIQFSGLGGGYVQVARIAAGLRVQLERNYAFGAAFGVRDFGSVNFSNGAVLLRRRAAKLRTLGISFPWAKRDEIEEKVQPLIELCAGQEPIVLVTDPAADSERQNRCYFGLLTGELGTLIRTASAWEWRINLVDLIPIPKAT